MIKDVEPLLKECEETLTELKAMGEMNGACYVQGFINSINKLPNVKRPQWIPCSKQVPSDVIHVDDMVLVCYEDGSIRFNSFMDGNWVQGNPIAWMPLPEPYREEGGEE